MYAVFWGIGRLQCMCLQNKGELIMAISVAVQKGNSVYVYDESNRTLFIKSGELHGYTSTTVSVRRGKSVYTFDERGCTKSIRSC